MFGKTIEKHMCYHEIEAKCYIISKSSTFISQAVLIEQAKGSTYGLLNQ